MSAFARAWGRIAGSQQRRRLRAVAHVGEEYRRSLHRDDDEGTAIQRSRAGDGTTAADALERLDHLADAVQRDFAIGDVVSVDGWRLSVTEARAAALVALRRPRRGTFTGGLARNRRSKEQS